ncbi:MAG: hypothetical protein FJ161_03875, partial [Gammaproteobacteria bacterium]|nr:hypothetical protein [Gammaproteobacteria bacterium]
MIHDSDNLFQSHLRELHDILTSQLRSAGILANIHTQEDVRGIRTEQKKLLSSCRKFYQNIRDNFKNYGTEQDSSQLSIFIEHTISFNKELNTLKEKLFNHTFANMIRNSLFPKIQDVIDAIKKAINAIQKSMHIASQSDSWASKVNMDIQLCLYIQDNMINLHEKEISDIIYTNLGKLTDLIKSKNSHLWRETIHTEHLKEHLNIVKLLFERTDISNDHITNALEQAVELGNIELITYIIEQSRANRDDYIQILFNKNLHISYEREPKTPWYQLENIASTYNKNISQLYTQAHHFTQNHSDVSKQPRWSAVNEFLKIKLTILPPHNAPHNVLILAGQKLGYPLNNKGICNGYTMRWIEASLLKQQPKFFNRIDNIMLMHSLLSKEYTLEQLKQKPEWKNVLWDIKAFYESLFLYQNTELARSILAQYVNQYDIHVISSIAASDEIEKIGGIKRSSILRYDEFSKQGLSRTLELLKQQIKKSQYQEIVCFLLNGCSETGLHLINITYYPATSSWQWMDINLKKIFSANTLAELIDVLDNIEFIELLNTKYFELYRTFCN